MSRSATAQHNPAKTVLEILRDRATGNPEGIAYTFLTDGEVEQPPMSYAALDRRARAIASVLQQSGASNERAVLLFEPSLDYITAFFGCLYASTIAVPAYPPNPGRPQRMLARIRSILLDVKPTLILTTAQLRDQWQASFSEDPHLRHVRWLATDVIVDGEASSWREPGINEQTIAFLQYTSGSTAVARGVILTHAHLVHNLGILARAFGFEPGETFVSWLPPYHDMGLIAGLISPLYGGLRSVVMSPFSFIQRPLRWLQAMHRYRGNVSGAPNFAYDLCVRKVDPDKLEPLDLSDWKCAFNGAEPIRAATLEAFSRHFERWGLRREALYPCYGLAEGTLMISGGNRYELPVMCAVDSEKLEQHQVVEVAPGDSKSRRVVSSGEPRDDLVVDIVDPKTLSRAPPGRVGEIWVKGPSVAGGYWNKPDESKQIFQAELSEMGEGPYLRTGDLGFVKDGQLYICGRTKDMIIVEGRNLYPQDIELTVETSHRALRSGCCAAFPLESDEQERIGVAIELAPGWEELGPAELEEVFQAVRRSVSREHEVPVRSIALLKPGSIPKTSSGKVQRHACRVGLEDGTLEPVAVGR